MATKKSQTTTKKSKSTQVKETAVAFEPGRVTFGVAALAAVTLVVFALLLATQIY